MRRASLSKPPFGVRPPICYNCAMNHQAAIRLALAASLASFCSAAIEFAEPLNVPPLFEPGVTPRSEAGWRNTRRPELKKMLATEVY